MRSSEFYAKKFLETVWVTSQLYDETYKVEDDLIKLFFMAQREAVEKTLEAAWDFMLDRSYEPEGDEIIIEARITKKSFLNELAAEKILGEYQ